MTHLLKHPFLLRHTVPQRLICVVWSLGSVALGGALAANGISWPPSVAFGIPDLQKTSYCFPSQQVARE